MKVKTTIGIIFGGRSGEHEVSLASARSVLQFIDKDKYEVIPIFITPHGQWLMPQDTVFEKGDKLNLSASHTSGERYGYPLLFSPDYSQPTVLKCPDLNKAFQIDLFFPLLHGSFGEDGTIQGLFDLIGAPYVGADVAASAVSMDKSLMKAVFRANNLPILPYLVMKRLDWENKESEILKSITMDLEYPLFIKPASLGSSVGITKVTHEGQLKNAIKLAAQYDRKVIVEQGILCHEVECAILGNDDPQASVVGAIIPKRDFYDYQAKYIEGLTDFVIPAHLEDRILEEVRFLAREAFLAVDAAGMARVDFFVRRSDNKVFLNEINTIPGFTSQSMYPKLWEAAGVKFKELIDRLIELAWERHEDKARNITQYNQENDVK